MKISEKEGMINKVWLEKYFELYRAAIFDDAVHNDLLLLKGMIEQSRSNGKKVMLIGNGGSAAIASHVSVDLAKNTRVRSMNFNEVDLITCLSNDYGYAEWMAKCIEFYGDPGDMAILISSSGRSVNLLKAAEQAKKMDIQVVTFTGFDADNPLRGEGIMNFWVDSHAYNIVEMTHQIWLLAICDCIIGKAEYSARLGSDD